MRQLAILPVFLAGLAACSGGGQTDGGTLVDGDVDGEARLADDAGINVDATTDATFGGCQGTALSGVSVVDVALASVIVSGTVTLNGQPVPASALPQGYVKLVEQKTKVSYQALLGGTGFRTSVTPGTYDISYDPAPAFRTDCKGKLVPDTAFPCTGGLVAQDVVLTAAQALTLDVPVAQISGNVTSKGTALIDSNISRGDITFHRPAQEPLSEEALTLHLGTFGAFTYTTRVMPGLYDVRFDHVFCASVATPCNSGVLESNLSIVANASVDLDLPGVLMAGTVTAGGAALVDQPTASGRGAIVYRGSDGSELLMVIGKMGAPTINASMFPGTYDQYYLPPDGTQCLALQMPCTGGLIKKGTVATTDFNGSVDVPVGTISGTVTVNGALLADASGSRGAIGFKNRDNGHVHRMDLGTTGAFTYSLRVVPGHYDLWYFTSNAAKAGSQLPSASALLQQDVTLADASVIDVDILSVAISGNVTVNGAPIGDQASDRGSVFLFASGEEQIGPIAVIPLGIVGAVSYTLRLAPGSYDVRFGPLGCPDGGTVPCNEDLVTKGLPVTGAATLSIDVPMASISGLVSNNGIPLADQTNGRGHVLFSHPHATGKTTAPVQATGPSAYATRIVAGDYVVSYEVAGSAFCTTAAELDGSTPPCTGQIVRGCGAP